MRITFSICVHSINVFTCKQIIENNTLSSSEKQRILGNLNIFLSKLYSKVFNKDISELTTNMTTYLYELESLNTFEKIKHPKNKKEILHLRVNTQSNINRQIKELQKLRTNMFRKHIPSSSNSNLKKYLMYLIFIKLFFLVYYIRP